MVTVGTFDGLHRGHMTVLGLLREEASRLGMEPMVVTFDRHPLETVSPDRAPALLMMPDTRDAMMRRAGVEVERVAFTDDVRRMTAESWMRRLASEYGAKVLVLGYDNTFGSDGLMLRLDNFRAIGKEIGMRVETAPAVAGCSSSAARKAVAEGRMEEAREILGRPFSIRGVVEHGRGLGHTIGVPTANVSTSPRQLLPLAGVYKGRVRLGRDVYGSVVNVGSRPTVSDGKRIGVEAHIIGFDGNLYGREIEVEFIRRLRDERKFPDLESLRRQIQLDIASV